jgi:hypothetical protein
MAEKVSGIPFFFSTLIKVNLTLPSSPPLSIFETRHWNFNTKENYIPCSFSLYARLY